MIWSVSGAHVHPVLRDQPLSVATICLPRPPHDVGDSFMRAVVALPRVVKVELEGVVELHVSRVLQRTTGLTCDMSD